MAMRSLTNDTLVELLDTHTQRLSALAKRLRRYTESNQRWRQNKSFNADEKQFYRQLKNDRPDFADGLPNVEEVTEFWSGIWERPVSFQDTGLLSEEETWCHNENLMIDNVVITEDDISDTLKVARNWAAPGIDGLQNYWYKKFIVIHSKLAALFNCVLHNPNQLPPFMTLGITYLLSKDNNTSNPAKYRPITCLPCLYKILTTVVSRKIQAHCTRYNIMTEEQKGCKKRYSWMQRPANH
jgi:hypothetical protein